MNPPPLPNDYVFYWKRYWSLKNKKSQPPKELPKDYAKSWGDINKVETVKIHTRTELRSCHCKKRYTTKKQADYVAQMIWLRTLNIDKHPVESYRCQFCRHYHVGHAPGKFIKR